MSQNGVNFPLPPAPSGGGGGGLPDPGSNGFVIRTGPGVTSAIALITNAYLQNSTVNYPAGTGLTGGGSISLGGTATAFAVTYGTTAGTSTQGNDARLPPAPSAVGRLLYDSGTAWQALAAGTTGQVLLANGAAAPSWGALPFSSLTSKPTTLAGYGITDAVATTDGRLSPAPSVAGRILYDNGTSWTVLAPGTSNDLLHSGTTPSWGKVDLATQVTGSLGNASLQNNTVNYPAGTGLSGGGSVALGGTATAFSVLYGTTAGTAAQGNDVRLPPAPAAAGRILYDNGTAWTTLSPGTDGQVLVTHGPAVAPSWGSVPQAPQRIVLAAMAPTGTWSNGQFIGPNYSTFSSSAVTGYTGSGVCRMKKAGTLSRITIDSANTSAYNFDVYLYIGPAPDNLSFLGFIIAVQIGQFVNANNVDTLAVAEGDCIAFCNSDTSNTWGCGALSIVADFTPA